jgi:CheY-like chemotaxis protein
MLTRPAADTECKIFQQWRSPAQWTILSSAMIDRATEPIAAEQMTEPAPLLAGLHVLVVDDHEDTREMLEQAFAFFGAEVTIAVTAEDAMRSAGNADVVITDFALKGKDGGWLLEQINTSPRPIPVVLLSGFVATQSDTRFALNLLKPVDPMDLAMKIRAILDVPRQS